MKLCSEDGNLEEGELELCCVRENQSSRSLVPNPQQTITGVLAAKTNWSRQRSAQPLQRLLESKCCAINS